MPDPFTILGGISNGLNIAEKVGKALQQYADGEYVLQMLDRGLSQEYHERT